MKKLLFLFFMLAFFSWHEVNAQVDCSSDPTASPVVIFTEDFETGGVDNFASTNFSGDTYAGSGTNNGLWHIRPSNAGLTGGTGPAGPQSGTTFAYFEGSGSPYTNKIITAGPINLTSATIDAELSFYYHMYGNSNMGALAAEVSPDNTTWTSVFSVSGAQQAADTAPWIQATVDLTSTTPSYLGQTLYVRFIFSGGSGSKSDIGVDLVEVTTCGIPGCTAPLAANYLATATVDDGSCNMPDCSATPTATNSTLYSEGFDGTSSGFTGDLHPGSGTNNGFWHYSSSYTGGTGSTGPSGPATGAGYFFFESSSGAHPAPGKSVTSPLIDLTSTTITDATLSYYTHLYGKDIVTFTTEITTDCGVTWTTLDVNGEVQTDETDPWDLRGFDLSAYLGQAVQIRFTIISDGSSKADVGIDLFEVNICETPVVPLAGCTDACYAEYDANATTDDGSCATLVTIDDCLGCVYEPTPVVAVDCSADPMAISTVRYYEAFDAGENAASFSVNLSGSDKGKWAYFTGGTGTGSTGPSDDVSVGGGYMYLEASDGPYSNVIVTGPPVSLLGQVIDARLSYYIHMYGAVIESLTTEITTDGGATWAPIAHLIGEQQGDETDPWLQVGADLSPYIGQIVQLRFVGETGNDNTGDMAVDEVEVTVCEIPPVPLVCNAPSITDMLFVEEFDNSTTFTGDVNNGDGTWRFDANTTGSGNTGPSGPFSGSHYTFLEAGNGPYASVQMVSPPISLTTTTSGNVLAGNVELSYYTHMYGEHIGALLTEITTDGGATWNPIALLAGQYQSVETDPWDFNTIDLTSYIGQTIQIRFTGSTVGEPRGDISIDLFEVTACYIEGCTDATACNYDPAAIVDDGTCLPVLVAGTDFVTPTTFCGGDPIVDNSGLGLVIMYNDGAGGPTNSATPPAALTLGDPLMTVNYSVSFPGTTVCAVTGSYIVDCTTDCPTTAATALSGITDGQVFCETDAAVNLTGTNDNGFTAITFTFSGMGVTDGGDGLTATFDPSTANASACGTSVNILYASNGVDANLGMLCNTVYQDVNKTKTVTVYGVPTVGVDFTTPTTFCGGAPIVADPCLTVLYDDGAGGPMTNTAPPAALNIGDPVMTVNYTIFNPTAPAACSTTGSYMVSCVVSGCPTPANTSITAGVVAGQTFCNTDVDVALTGVNDNSIASAQFVFAGTGVTDGGDGVSGTFSPSGAVGSVCGLAVDVIYSITATDPGTGLDCSSLLDATVTVPVTVYSAPVQGVDFTLPTTFCGGAPIVADPCLTVLYDDGAGGAIVNTAPPAALNLGDPNMTVNYTVSNASAPAGTCMAMGSYIVECQVCPTTAGTSIGGLSAGQAFCDADGDVALTGVNDNSVIGAQFVFAGTGVTDGGDGVSGTFSPSGAIGSVCGMPVDVTYSITATDPSDPSGGLCPDVTQTVSVTVYSTPVAGTDYVLPTTICGGTPIIDNSGCLTITYDNGAGGPIVNTTPPPALAVGASPITVNYTIFNSNASSACLITGSYVVSCTTVMGCTDATACNYNVAANIDDGSCAYATGCDACSGATDGTGTVVPCFVATGFSIADPCVCNDDQSANGAGDGTFSELVTVNGPSGLFVRAKASSTGLDIPVQSLFTEVSPGVYELPFNHVDGIGFTVDVEVSNVMAGPYTDVLDGAGMLLSVGNTCYYPVLSFDNAPPFVCAGDPDLPVTASVTEAGVVGTSGAAAGTLASSTAAAGDMLMVSYSTTGADGCDVTITANVPVLECNPSAGGGGAGLSFIFPIAQCPPGVAVSGIERVCEGNALFVASSAGVPLTGAFTYVWYSVDLANSSLNVAAEIIGNPYYSPTAPGAYTVAVVDLANDCVILLPALFTIPVEEIVSCKDCPE